MARPIRRNPRNLLLATTRPAPPIRSISTKHSPQPHPSPHLPTHFHHTTRDRPPRAPTQSPPPPPLALAYRLEARKSQPISLLCVSVPLWLNFSPPLCR